MRGPQSLLRYLLPAVLETHSRPLGHALLSSHARPAIRSLHLLPSRALKQKPLPPLPVLLPADITETFLRGTGPGGQKINKTSCAVQLIHHPTGIVVKCQESRSRVVNRAVARKWLAERVEERLLGDGSRVRMREKREGERKRSAEKKRRRKYRALEAEKEGGENASVQSGKGVNEPNNGVVQTQARKGDDSHEPDSGIVQIRARGDGIHEPDIRTKK